MKALDSKLYAHDMAYHEYKKMEGAIDRFFRELEPKPTSGFRVQAAGVTHSNGGQVVRIKQSVKYICIFIQSLIDLIFHLVRNVE